MEKQIVDELRRANQLTQALLSLYIRDIESRTPEEGAPRLELVLAASGLGYQEIATLMRKKPDAVRMLLGRNKDIIKNI